MVSLKFLAGGYDVFIATYLFTASGDTASLELTARSPSGINPSWLAFHPDNQSLVYATNEWYRGAVQVFGLNTNGTLTAALDSITSEGDSPAHILPIKSSGQLVITNYGGGNGKIVDTTSTGRFIPQGAQTIAFPKPAGNPLGVSHPHEAYEYNDEVWIPDLGSDAIWRLIRNNDPSSKDIYKFGGSIPQPRGSGPRHIKIYNNRLFVVHELSSELSVQKIPPAGTNETHIIAIVKTPPADFNPRDARWAGAEILIPAPSPAFPTPYIYYSNRNKGPTKDPRGDSIAIYEHVGYGTENEGLQLVKQVFTSLDQIRGMLFAPGDEYLVAAASEGTKGVAVLRRVDGGRDLKVVARNTAVGARNTFLWVP